MSDAPPMYFLYDGEAMIPKSARFADRHYVVGQTYQLAPAEDRSEASHGHQFAWLKEAWLQLPHDLADLYPTPEHLRKRALIDVGYYDEEIIDCGSNAAALRVASSIRRREDFALVIVRGAFVIIRTAKSQSRRAMKNREFQDSKQKIMNLIAGMIGVDPDALARHAGRAA